MIVLDTNVVSEAVRLTPDRHVLSWLGQQDIRTVFLTAMTVAELRVGAAMMPAGRRRTELTNQLETEILPAFAGRVLSFEEADTVIYAEQQVKTRAAGRPMGAIDALIAAVSASRGYRLATRNVRDFEALGISLINPWEG